MARDELTDDELVEMIGEAACASRPAPDGEPLAEYLKRITREDEMLSPRAAVPTDPSVPKGPRGAAP